MNSCLSNLASLNIPSKDCDLLLIYIRTYKFPVKLSIQNSRNSSLAGCAILVTWWKCASVLRISQSQMDSNTFVRSITEKIVCLFRTRQVNVKAKSPVFTANNGTTHYSIIKIMRKAPVVDSTAPKRYTVPTAGNIYMDGQQLKNLDHFRPRLFRNNPISIKLNTFWEQEEVPATHTQADEFCEYLYCKTTICQKDGKHTVKLPFKM